jgi:transcriptional regulator with XRE-family HTH domain
MDGLDEATIGDRIRRTRINRKLGQVQLARRAGVDKSTVARIELKGSGRTSTVRKLAAALAVTTDEPSGHLKSREPAGVKRQARGQEEDGVGKGSGYDCGSPWRRASSTTTTHQPRRCRAG